MVSQSQTRVVVLSYAHPLNLKAEDRKGEEAIEEVRVMTPWPEADAQHSSANQQFQQPQPTSTMQAGNLDPFASFGSSNDAQKQQQQQQQQQQAVDPWAQPQAQQHAMQQPMQQPPQPQQAGQYPPTEVVADAGRQSPPSPMGDMR